jgi:predicted metal-dependent peptidase
MKINELERVVKILAREYKIEIKAGESWAANIKSKKVFYRQDDVYNLSEDHVLGLILHEVSHVLHTDNVELGNNNPELTHSTLNMLEDIVIEKIIGGEYPNAGEILESTKEEVLNNLLKILPKLKISAHEKSLLFAATRFEGRGYSTGLEPYEKLGEQISEIMIKRKDEIMNRKQTKDLMPIVTEIVELIIKNLGEPTPEEKRQMEQNSNTGNASETDREGTIKRKSINALKAGKGWQEGIEMSHSVAMVNEICDLSTFIGKKLRTILKRNNAMEFGGRYRSGKLMAKRFVRVKVLKDRNPFARRIVKSNQSYAFAIASDISGSMFDASVPRETFGSYALSSMLMVGEALRIAGIPRSMTIFGYRTNTVAPMGKKQITFEQLGNDKAIRKAGQGGTEVDKAMYACIKELELVKAERKIMIILTDGSSYLPEMKEAHKKAIEAGIEPLGITIGQYGSSNMEETFGKNKNRIIEDTRNKKLIGQAFIDILKESVKASTI